MSSDSPTLEKVIKRTTPHMTPKNKIIADYVMENPQQAVFMTTRQLASASGVSEATVVRFVRQLGFESYAVFIKQLRNHIDTGLTLMERSRITIKAKNGEQNAFTRLVAQEIENLSFLGKNMDMDEADKIITRLSEACRVLVIGSRLSYSLANYMGWTMTKVRQDITILKGSDRTTIDWLAIAPENTVVVIVATSRYPNELIRVGKMVRRQGHSLILLTDSSSCPLLQFSDHSLIAPMLTIPFLGSITSLSCLINYLVHALAKKRGDDLNEHQEKLEQAYLENDILFNLETRPEKR
ncbi:MurR/RpiR family transcriptional regulator [Desulfocicer niacini]